MAESPRIRRTSRSTDARGRAGGDMSRLLWPSSRHGAENRRLRRLGGWPGSCYARLLACGLGSETALRSMRSWVDVLVSGTVAVQR